jgi:hypothetical protein
MDLTVRKGEQVTHPFDEFLQKATLTPTMKPSQHPICRQAPLSASLQQKMRRFGFPAQPSQLSSHVVPNQADLRAIQRWKEADRDGGGTLDFNEVCPHCALPFVSHPSPSPSPLRLPRLAASLPDRHPSSDDGYLWVDGRAGQAVRIPRCSLVLRAGAVCRFMAQDRRWSMRSTAGAAGRSDGADRWVLTYDLRSLSSSRI